MNDVLLIFAPTIGLIIFFFAMNAVITRLFTYKESEVDGRMPNSDEILGRYGRPEAPTDKSQERGGCLATSAKTRLL